MKKITVSVGIAAFNAQRNLENMLHAILKQKNNNFTLNKIIIHSDNSTDNTVKIARSFKNPIITVIDNKDRRGFAGSLKTIIQKSRGDILVLFNDDIEINDQNLINKLIKPFLADSKAGLVCGHPLPFTPRNFIEGAGVSSFNAYDRMRTYINNGESEYSVDGKILVLSRQFINKFIFPSDLKEMGNTDVYLYFACISEGFNYHFVKNAVVSYRYPNKLKDLIKWYTRNNANRYILKKHFGQIVDKQYYKPPLLFWRCLAPEFIKNPLGSTFIIFLSFYIQRKSKQYAQNFNPTWDVVSTTKSI